MTPSDRLTRVRAFLAEATAAANVSESPITEAVDTLSSFSAEDICGALLDAPGEKDARWKRAMDLGVTLIRCQVPLNTRVEEYLTSEAFRREVVEDLDNEPELHEIMRKRIDAIMESLRLLRAELSR